MLYNVAVLHCAMAFVVYYWCCWEYVHYDYFIYSYLLLHALIYIYTYMHLHTRVPSVRRTLLMWNGAQLPDDALFLNEHAAKLWDGFHNWVKRRGLFDDLNPGLQRGAQVGRIKCGSLLRHPVRMTHHPLPTSAHHPLTTSNHDRYISLPMTLYSIPFTCMFFPPPTPIHAPSLTIISDYVMAHTLNTYISIHNNNRAMSYSYIAILYHCLIAYHRILS